MNPDDNLYAQFLVADKNMSCDRIMRIARFCMDSYLAAAREHRLMEAGADIDESLA